jgi:hypothetical protein
VGPNCQRGRGRAELGRLGRGEGGKERGRAAWVGPNSAQPRGVLFFFFWFLFLFFSFSTFVSFYFFFLWIKNFSKWSW